MYLPIKHSTALSLDATSRLDINNDLNQMNYVIKILNVHIYSTHVHICFNHIFTPTLYGINTCQMILFMSVVDISTKIRNDFNEISCAITCLYVVVVSNEVFMKSSSAAPQF